MRRYWLRPGPRGQVILGRGGILDQDGLKGNGCRLLTFLLMVGIRAPPAWLPSGVEKLADKPTRQISWDMMRDIRTWIERVGILCRRTRTWQKEICISMITWSHDHMIT